MSQANKLSRTYAALLDALNHHRGKGQQKVTVEHVLLATALIIAATTWAFSPNPAAPIPPSEVIYQPQHWNAY